MKHAKVIYICSAGHSGSTLLDLLLSSHSDISSLGEISHLPKNLALNTPCTCGEPIQTCSVWGRVAKKIKQLEGVDIFKNPYDFSLGYFNSVVIVDRNKQTLLYRLRSRVVRGFQYLDLKSGVGLFPKFFPRQNATTKNNFTLYDVFSEVSGTNYVVDSSKSYIKAVELYRRHPDRVKVILLSRDGRGVFYSNIKHGFDRKASVRSWFNFYNRALDLIPKYVNGDDLLSVKYEDLTANPEATLQTICSFAGLDFEAQMLDFNRKTHHSTNGNNMRFNKSAEIRQDKGWKNKLSDDELSYFEKYAGELNFKLGYQ